MRPDVTSDAMAALLRILERVEHPIDEAPIASPRQFTRSREESEPRLANRSAAGQDNRLVERIASAMLKSRVQGG
jgi:hypothetical protein